MTRTDTQSSLPLAFGVVRNSPKDASPKVLRQTRDKAHALRLMMRAGKLKNSYIAFVVGCDQSHVSRMKNGQREISEDMAKRLCAATGSNLLMQWIEANRPDEDDRDAQLAELLRSVA